MWSKRYMFEATRYNWRIHRLLRRLARQRVVMVLQPGNVWVVEYAVEDTDDTDALLKTCYMRDWVEPLQESVPKGRLRPDGSLPDGPVFEGRGPLWKLTDSGWAAIQRRHEITVLGIFVAVVAAFVPFIA